ncbi:MAG: type VI secretion system accessory protein TagJ [Acidobacteria bacterium]|nr:type VI secretion system accessory protein TagJ [Acidobacteriota bacterium]
MTPRELFQAGKLNETIQALSAELRENPTDAKRRTFLFELLCFAGDYNRAEKQLNVLAQENQQAGMGGIVYHSALHAERTRQGLFERKEYTPPAESEAATSGILDGNAFEDIEDADPRIGRRLEVFAAGAYLWLPFEHIASLEIQKPTRLRDLLWIPALVRTGPAFRDKELGEVLLPVMTPLAWRDLDDQVRLGRITDWREEDGVTLPAGQKMLLVDGEEVPLLDIRKLEFNSPVPAAGESAS